MIRVHRPKTVPIELRRQRKVGLGKAFAALNTHGAASEELKATLVAYDGGKAALYRAQHRKCAYCDRRAGLAGNHLEHFRPKKEAHRHLPGESPAVVTQGYWWLTWSWSNHLFACASCNTGHKKNHFPLAQQATALVGPEAPYRRNRLLPAHERLSAESALLVDPAAQDPLDHIVWRLVNPNHPPQLWKWSPSGRTPEGEATIRVLGLRSLADDVAAHVRDNLLARTTRICELVDQGKHTAARAAWRQLGQNVACAHSELAGPTWNALHLLVDAARRAKAKLPDLPRP